MDEWRLKLTCSELDFVALEVSYKVPLDILGELGFYGEEVLKSAPARKDEAHRSSLRSKLTSLALSESSWM